MKINDKFYLLTDECNFILARKNTIDSNYEYLGYYGQLEQALNRFVDYNLKQSTATTLDELKNDIQKIREEIKSLVEKLKESGFETERTAA